MHIIFASRKQRLLSAEMARSILCFFFFFLCLLALLHPSYSGAVTRRKRNVPAMFVFGDSIVDGGNNVFVDPNCTTDTLPYGIDFPTGPTGRFTNGRNPADILSQLLRIPRFLPAAKDPKTTGGMILYGVNYASGGSGILDYPGSLFISLSKQIKHFQTITIPDLRTQFNNRQKLSSYLAKSIFVFNSGGNDCAQECSGSVRKEKCASDEFLESLLANFTHQLKIVYNLGARKFVLFGVQANGCNPQNKATLLPTEKCREDMNHAAITFNSLLRSSIDGMKKSLQGSNFVFVNTYGIVRNVFDNPQPYGFKVVNQSCCTISTGMRGGACVQGSMPCKHRRTYMYYDGAHLTQALYRHLVKKAYTSKLRTEVYPFNVAYLAGLP
ncbi:GDSL esterase/lipase At1g29670-like isoform X1 [Nymphaea colorata]|nr:GDSL esterase/lipase At1g29670-like isoform X1 [Nymphaea colorata]